MTSRAVISEFNWAVRPTVRRWPRSETGPSTLPSICRSSSLEISPFTTIVAPRHANVCAVGLLGRLTAGAFSGAPGILDSFDGDVPGTSDCVSLFHIAPPTLLSTFDLVLTYKDHSIDHFKRMDQAGLPLNGIHVPTSE